MYSHGQYVRSGGRELPGSETRVGGLGMGWEKKGWTTARGPRLPSLPPVFLRQP
jgi:hypothetical protein